MAAHLVDLDGVIFRNKAVQAFVQRKCVNYVSNTLKVPYPRAEDINNRLYKAHGHTLLGLRNEYHVDDTCLKFARQVYDHDTFRTLADNVKPKVEGADAKDLLNNLSKSGASLYIFTNAPYAWAATIIHMYGLGDRITDILSSDSLLLGDSLKRDPAVYANVNEHLRKSGIKRIDFTDDDPKNLVPVLGMWKTHWYRYKT